MSRSVVILGSTGSIGVSTLDLLTHAEEAIELLALTAGRNVALLAEQALRWRPKVAIIEDPRLLGDLQQRLAGSGVSAASGGPAIVEAAGQGADWVMSAIVGAAGLAPTLAAARAGSIVALANKESLVCAGPILLAIAREAGGRVIPVDSEHSAIFQVFAEDDAARVRRLILTASGGPFRSWTRADMAKASPAQAVAHPNWSMGAKISVDSATMMNKGLEMIEASYLFGMPAARIEVLVHPQSVVHSLVEYADGSTLAQLGPPDMRSPIACAWSWPRRMAWPAADLDLAKVGSLTFEAPDVEKFPALAIARRALESGAGAPAAMNAANEIAVAAFLGGRLGFLEIATLVSETLDQLEARGELSEPNSSDAVEWAMATDRAARDNAAQVLSRLECRERSEA